jgi:hypothetical protein
MNAYVHGYGTPEQERLVQQAEHWRHRLIRDGTELEPGARLIEVGTGVGAVLAVPAERGPRLGRAQVNRRALGVELTDLVKRRCGSPMVFVRSSSPTVRRRNGRSAAMTPSDEPVTLLRLERPLFVDDDALNARGRNLAATHPI